VTRVTCAHQSGSAGAFLAGAFLCIPFQHSIPVQESVPRKIVLFCKKSAATGKLLMLQRHVMC